LGLWAQKSLFIVPITTALNIDRSAFGFADTMRYIATAVVNLFFGVFVAKFGIKRLILLGFIFLIGAAFCYTLANSLIIFYLGGALLGVGLSWVGTAVVAYIVNKVCKQKKGTIMGFILAANGIGGCIATLLITPYINGEDTFGYRKFFYLMAGIFFGVFLLILFLFKEPQMEDNEKQKNTSSCEWEGLEWNIAKKKAYFYLACVCIFLTGMVLQGVSGIYAARMRDVGLPQNIVSIIAILASVFLALFKFVNGYIYDKKGLRFITIIDCTASIGVMVVLFFISYSTVGIILAVLYTILAGIALPLETVIVPIYAKELFGQKSFNKVLGVFVSINQVGYAVSSPVINLCYDITKSYNIALVICAVIMLFVVLCLQYVISSSNKEKQ